MRLLRAEPDAAAVRAGLRELVVAAAGGLSWAAVGPLAGEREELMHLGRHAVRLGVSYLVVVGAAAPVHAGAVLEGSWGEESRHVQDEGAAVALLRGAMQDDGAVLVAGLPQVLRALQKGSGDAA